MPSFLDLEIYADAFADQEKERLLIAEQDEQRERREQARIALTGRLNMRFALLAAEDRRVSPRI